MSAAESTVVWFRDRCDDSVVWQWGLRAVWVRAVGVEVSPEPSCCLYVAQASSLIRLMLPPSCSGSLLALRSSPGFMLPVAAVPLPPPPPPPPPPVSSRSLPSKELALLLTLSAGERPVGGSRHSREPGYWGGAVSIAPWAVEDDVLDDRGGQGVLLSRPGDTGSDLMLTLEFVFTVSMAPWGKWVTGRPNHSSLPKSRLDGEPTLWGENKRLESKPKEKG